MGSLFDVLRRCTHIVKYNKKLWRLNISPSPQSSALASCVALGLCSRLDSTDSILGVVPSASMQASPIKGEEELVAIFRGSSFPVTPDFLSPITLTHPCVSSRNRCIRALENLFPTFSTTYIHVGDIIRLRLVNYCPPGRRSRTSCPPRHLYVLYIVRLRLVNWCLLGQLLSIHGTAAFVHPAHHPASIS